MSMPVASSGFRSGLPARSGWVGVFGPGTRIAGVDRRPGDQVAERRRAVAARQAEAHLVAALRDRASRPRAAAASRRCSGCCTSGSPSATLPRVVMPSQRRPAWADQCRRQVPLVLRVGGEAQRRGATGCRRTSVSSGWPFCSVVRVSSRRFDFDLGAARPGCARRRSTSTSLPLLEHAACRSSGRRRRAMRDDARRRSISVRELFDGARDWPIPTRALGAPAGAEAVVPLAVQAQQRRGCTRRRSRPCRRARGVRRRSASATLRRTKLPWL